MEETRVVGSAENTIHIVAGNVKQAKFFARKHGIYPRHWDFVDDPKLIKTLSGSVVYTGTFYQRIDIKQIEQEVRDNPRLKVLDTDG